MMKNNTLPNNVKQIAKVGKAFLVVALMCFSTHAAMAQGLTYTHYWCNGKFWTNPAHTLPTSDNYTTVTALLADVDEPVIRLDEDYTADGNIAISGASKTLTIDLYGHSFIAGGGSSYVNLFSVSSNGTLTVYDHAEIPLVSVDSTASTSRYNSYQVIDGSIYFQKPTGSAMQNGTNGYSYKIDPGKIILKLGTRAVTIAETGTFNFYSGTIMGTSGNATVNVYSDNYMKTAITGLQRNTGTSGLGVNAGGVYVDGGTFNMYGGTITKCQAGTYTISSAPNTTSSGSGNGGAMFIPTGKSTSVINIVNGAVRFCQAGYSGGALMQYDGTSTIGNGCFEYCAGVHDAGFILYFHKGSMTINGGKFRYGVGGGQYNNLGRSGTMFTVWDGQRSEAVLNINGGLFERNTGNGIAFGGNQQLTSHIKGATFRHFYQTAISIGNTNATVYIGGTNDNGVGTKILNNNSGNIGIDPTGMSYMTADGGGIALTKGNLYLEGALKIAYNRARRGGGIYADGGNGTLTIRVGLDLHNNEAFGTSSNQGRGGGIYVRNDITMTGGNIHDNTASLYGGGVCVETPFSVAINLEGGTIQDNTASIDGGGLAALTSSIPSDETYRQNITGSWGISAFNLTYPASEVIESNYSPCTIVGHIIYLGSTNGTGGPEQGSSNYAIYRLIHDTEASVYIGKDDGSAGPTITGNHAASGNGGGIYQGKGNMTVYAGTVSNNDAQYGAGLYVNTGGVLSVKGGTISGNTASVNGGGFFVNPGSGTTSIDCTKANTTISGNSAVLGAGAYVASGTLTIDGPASGSKYTKLIGNTASTSGGGVYVAAGTVTVTNAIIGASGSANTATNGNGGGIYVIGDATITNSTLAYNTSPATTSGNGLGGGVYVATGGTFTLDGGSVNNNSAGNNGGGFYVDPGSGATTYIKNLHGNVTVNSNEAKLGAGAYVASGDLDIDGTTSGKTFVMSSNIASVSGGGAYVQGGTIGINKATLNANKANNGNGGGIYVSGDATVTGASTLSNNEASASGGGIYVASGSATVNGGSILSGNQAKGGSGGGIYAAGTTTASGSSTFDGNTAQVSGGGIYVASGIAEVTSCTLQNNTATTGNGGGLYSHGNATVTTSTLSSNTATAGNGGGVYVAAGGTFEIDGGTVSGNTAGGNGGGFYVDPGTVTPPTPEKVTYLKCNSGNLVISGNSAANGGGAYLNSGKLDIPAHTGSGSGTTTIKSNTATTSGGGLYVAAGSVELTDAIIGGDATEDGNTAGTSGGGVYAIGSVTATGSTIKHNTATTGDGGGVYTEGDATITTSTLSNNAATNGSGGGVYVASGGTFQIDGGEVSGNTAGGKGGGFYVDPDGSKTITYIKCDSDDIVISGNSAANGGGAYLKSGTLSIPASSGAYTTTIKSNTASASGGGLYVAAGSVELTDAIIGGDATGDGNTATSGHGGGIYALGPVTVSGSTIKYNKALNGNGGGIYAAAGSGNDITVQTTSTIAYNSSANGGGIYAYSGNVNVLTSSTIPYNSATVNGGGIYAAGGNITVKTGSSMTYNHANQYGGAIYANGGTMWVNNSTETSPAYTGNPSTVVLGNNDAQSGGAIYANGGTVNFRDGTIDSNYASQTGGALYISSEGTLTLSGDATLSSNHVPADGHGGGVYLAGVLCVGSEGGTVGTPKTDVIKVETNYHGMSYSYPATSDNVFLPNPVVNDDHKDVITIYPYGMDYDNTRVGFYVMHNLVPVVYCADENYLHTAWSAALSNRVFDDTYTYTSIHELTSLYYDKNYIYLSGGIWYEAVKKAPSTGFAVDPANENKVTISSPDALAWLISYVDGRGVDPTEPGLYPGCDPHPNVQVTLANDINMGARIWTPIGDKLHTLSSGFQGTFDGGGHTISGINTAASAAHSLFGVVENAVIKDVILDVSMPSSDPTGDLFYMGGIVQELKGTSQVLRCGVGGTLSSQAGTGTIIGGIAAKMEGTSKIEDCYFSGVMEGHKMGGLVGELTSGTVTNCFAYAKFITPSTSTSNCGGLAAENAGTFTNCYAHAATGSDLSHGNFGWLAGSNSGTFSYCYAPVDSNPYIYGTANRPANCGRFGATAWQSGKYGFAHCDQQITTSEGIISGLDASAFTTYVSQSNGPLSIVGNKTSDQRGELHGLLTILNKWVADNPGSSPGHFTWTRTMASPINDDCPVFVNPEFTCVGTPEGFKIGYGNVNALISNYNLVTDAFSSIYVYAAPGRIDVTTNSGLGGVRLYIPENMGILQNTGVTTNARVGVTFDNSKSDPSLWGEAYDWHMFSSALADAPLGVVYNPNGDSYTPAYGSTPPKTSWYQSDDPAVFATYDPTKVGYFPTDTPYGHPYTTDEVGSFDLYCYSEPFAHWINFKRNSNDHWHTMDHYNIHYTNEEGVSGNEDHFIKGKGYLAAISKTSMLMAEGTLNNGVVHIKTSYTDPGYYYGHDLKGVNLIGNPYQSYLDFDGFVNENSAALSTNAYYILDADKRGYVGYVPGASSSDVAPQFLHPHQGFLVLVNDGADQLTFTNDMRKIESEATGGADPYFRGEHIAYPLVSMTCTDSNGMNDFAIVELGRPETGGGEKLKGMHSGDASIWFHFDETDWYTAFTTPGINEAPLRFRAYEDGVFTLTWHPENAEFSYLHLIDNITGSDVDCLATDKYVFEGRVTDYTSRFRLKFDYSEENGSGTESETFAFMMGDELVVNGEGTLQIFDINGKLLRQQTVAGTQTVTTMPQYAAGVYVLRLVNNEQVKVQKMVINK